GQGKIAGSAATVPEEKPERRIVVIHLAHCLSHAFFSLHKIPGALAKRLPVSAEKHVKRRQFFFLRAYQSAYLEVIILVFLAPRLDSPIGFLSFRWLPFVEFH